MERKSLICDDIGQFDLSLPDGTGTKITKVSGLATTLLTVVYQNSSLFGSSQISNVIPPQPVSVVLLTMTTTEFEGTHLCLADLDLVIAGTTE